MTIKNKKRITSTFLVLCYCFGNLISPVTADSDGNISSLLEKRENPVEESTNTAETESVALGASSVDDFSDVKKEDWYYPYLDYLVSNKIINGKSKTEFAPDESFSFAECSAVITRYLGLDEYAGEMSYLLKSKNTKECEKWYSGYIQVMYELGIFRDTEGIFSVSEGLVHIDAVKAQAPMKRYEFASCIARSFELPDGKLRSKNIYSEVSGLGHDFITGGRYIDSYLNMYPEHIKDYEVIPEGARQDVLKVYYNGIFNGDTQGNFNPENLIKRSEMAKVLATVRDFSLRKSLITDYYTVVTEDKLFFDCFGNKSLDTKYSTQVLTQCASGFDASGNSIIYKPSEVLPYGYCVDVYLYSKAETRCKEVLRYTLSHLDATDKGFEHSFENGTDYRAILILRNLTENAKPEFALDVSISPDGILSKPLTV